MLLLIVLGCAPQVTVKESLRDAASVGVHNNWLQAFFHLPRKRPEAARYYSAQRGQPPNLPLLLRLEAGGGGIKQAEIKASTGADAALPAARVTNQVKALIQRTTVRVLLP